MGNSNSGSGGGSSSNSTERISSYDRNDCLKGCDKLKQEGTQRCFNTTPLGSADQIECFAKNAEDDWKCRRDMCSKSIGHDPRESGRNDDSVVYKKNYENQRKRD